MLRITGVGQPNCGTTAAGDNSITISPLNIPTAGTLLIMLLTAATTSSVPSISGWTLLEDDTSSSEMIAVYYQIAASSGIFPGFSFGVAGDQTVSIVGFPPS